MDDGALAGGAVKNVKNVAKVEQGVAIFSKDNGRLAQARQSSQQPFQSMNLRFTSAGRMSRIRNRQQQSTFFRGIFKQANERDRCVIFCGELPLAIIERQRKLLNGAAIVRQGRELPSGRDFERSSA